MHTQVCAWSFFCTNSAVQGMGAFVPTILSEFGWTNIKAQLYSVPPYVLACFLTIGLGYCSDRVNRRGIFMLFALCFSITGFAILRFDENVHAKYAAVFLNAIGVFAASSGFLSWGVNSTFEGQPIVRLVLNKSPKQKLTHQTPQAPPSLPSLAATWSLWAAWAVSCRRGRTCRRTRPSSTSATPSTCRSCSSPLS